MPRWATWDEFRRLEALGLTMYGQMTAGSWIYIGTQGILQGTYETFAECARQHFGGTLAGRLVVTAGLGGMGGAQPLAATHERRRISRRRRGSGVGSGDGSTTGYCDRIATTIWTSALAPRRGGPRRGARRSPSGWSATSRRSCRSWSAVASSPDVVTDQTSAHDLRVGYIPAGMSTWQQAAALRKRTPTAYEARVLDSMVAHVAAMLACKATGAVVFDYGNNLRGQVADHRGMPEAFRHSGVRSGVHPAALLPGRRPVSLGGPLRAIPPTSP